MTSAARILSILVLSAPFLYAQPQQPNLNEQFPIPNGRVLSPPIVLPVGECAKAVHVTGYMPHATVRVFAHSTELIGTENPYFAETDITLTRQLNAGESITATQELLGRSALHQ